MFARFERQKTKERKKSKSENRAFVLRVAFDVFIALDIETASRRKHQPTQTWTDLGKRSAREMINWMGAVRWLRSTRLPMSKHAYHFACECTQHIWAIYRNLINIVAHLTIPINDNTDGDVHICSSIPQFRLGADNMRWTLPKSIWRAKLQTFRCTFLLHQFCDAVFVAAHVDGVPNKRQQNEYWFPTENKWNGGLFIHTIATSNSNNNNNGKMRRDRIFR